MMLGKLSQLVSGKLRKWLFSDMEAEIAAAMGELDRKMVAQKRLTTQIKQTVSRQGDILERYQSDNGLSEAAVDELSDLIGKVVAEERKNTLFMNLEQRNLFLTEVQEYIRSHHHDSRYPRLS